MASSYAGNTYTTYGDVTFMNNAASMSFSLWAKFDVTTGDDGLITKGTSSTSRFLCWRDNSDSGTSDAITCQFPENDDNFVKTKSAASSVGSADVWYHIAVTYQSQGSFLAYINGSQSGSVVNSPSGTATGMYSDIGSSALFRVGEAELSSSWDLDGDIADIAIWTGSDAELSAGEIAALASGLSPLKVRPTKLQFYTPCHTAGDLDIIGGIVGSVTGTVTQIAHPPVECPGFVAVPVFWDGAGEAGPPPTAGELAAGSLALTGVGL